ncbi:MAG TPA: hypothetical protein VL588_12270 [Bdellovibrionota bacterium]|nr:hypothetical protein [Bdellovibrionota bacterium]
MIGVLAGPACVGEGFPSYNGPTEPVHYTSAPLAAGVSNGQGCPIGALTVEFDSTGVGDVRSGAYTFVLTMNGLESKTIVCNLGIALGGAAMSCDKSLPGTWAISPNAIDAGYIAASLDGTRHAAFWISFRNYFWDQVQVQLLKSGAELGAVVVNQPSDLDRNRCRLVTLTSSAQGVFQPPL